MLKLLTVLFVVDFALAVIPITLNVTIDDGDLLGSIMVDMNGRSFLAFQKIPFAKAPLGTLRFKDPQPVVKWTGVRDATQSAPMCLQKQFLYNDTMGGVEDCLFLNVYTPELNPTTLKPVVVFVHGGGFMEGSGTYTSYGPEILVSKDIVLVTVNYRLGILGFTSFNNTALGVPGNAGLKDQVAALKWVQKNIGKFGGNASQVTLAGESAGSGSVHLHLLSPLSQGLFQRAVMQSGSALSPWCNGEINNGIKSAEVLGFTGDDAQMLRSLQNATQDQLKAAMQNATILIRVDIPNRFGPVIEPISTNAFLTDTPRNIIKSGNFSSQVPVMLGTVSAEGMILDAFYTIKYGQYTPAPPQAFIPYNFYLNGNQRTELANNMTQVYNLSQDASNNNNGTISLSEDSYFTFPMFETIYGHLPFNQEMYLYLFSSDSTLNFLKYSNPRTPTYPGVCHMDDLWYLYTHTGTPSVAFTPGSIENKAINNSATLFANFVKYGKPTLAGDAVQWQKVTNTSMNYFNINLDKNYLKQNLDKVRIDFWCDACKKYGVDHFC